MRGTSAHKRRRAGLGSERLPNPSPHRVATHRGLGRRRLGRRGRRRAALGLLGRRHGCLRLLGGGGPADGRREDCVGLRRGAEGQGGPRGRGCQSGAGGARACAGGWSTSGADYFVPSKADGVIYAWTAGRGAITSGWRAFSRTAPHAGGARRGWAVEASRPGNSRVDAMAPAARMNAATAAAGFLLAYSLMASMAARVRGVVGKPTPPPKPSLWAPSPGVRRRTRAELYPSCHSSLPRLLPGPIRSLHRGRKDPAAVQLPAPACAAARLARG
jgi:hypothetical protein